MADGKVVIDSELNDKGLDNGLKNLQGKLESTGKKLQSIGGSLTKNLTLPIVAAGTGALLTAKKFDDSMRDVRATMGSALGKTTKEAEANFKALREEAIRLGATTAFSASEAAAGMKEFAQVGWDTNQILNATENALYMASASGEELGWTARTMAAKMNMFGMEAKDAGKASDILVEATNSSGMNMQELAQALEYAGKASYDAGNDLEQTSAILGIMADQGLVGSKAGTALTSMFDDLKSKVKGTTVDFGAFSTEIYDAQGNMRPMTDIIADIEKATAGMSDQQRDAALASVFGTQAMRGLSSVLGEGTDKVYALEEALYNSEGAAKAASDEMEGGIGGSLRALGSALESLAISFGDVLAPTVKKVADFLSEMALKFTGLSDGMKKAIVIVGSVLAAIGPFLTVLGTILMVIPKITAALATINPIVLAVIAVIGALVGIGIALYQNWETIKEKAIEVFSIFTPLFEAVQEAFQHVVDFIMDIWGQLVDFWLEHGTMLQEATSNIFSAIGAVIETVMNAVWAVMQFIWPVVEALILDTWNAIKNTIQGALDVIMGIVQAFGALFTGNWSALWDAIKQIVSGLVQAVWGLINLWFVGKILKLGKTFAKAFKDVITKLWNSVKSIFTSSLNAVRSNVSTVFNAIRSVISSIMNAVRSVITTVLNAIKSIFTGSLNAVRSTTSSVLNSIKSVFSNIFNSLKGVVTGAMNGVKNAVSNGIKGALNVVTNMAKNFFNAGKNIVTSIADGIKSAIGKVTGAISDVASKVRNFLPFSPAKEGPLMDIHRLNFGGPIEDSIQDAIPDVQAKMNAMLEMPTFQAPDVGEAFSVNKLIDKLQDKGEMIQIRNVLQVDGEILADVLADPIDTRLTNRINLESFMRGIR